MIDLDPGRPSTAGLLSDALNKISHLIGSELQLVGIEIGEKITVAVAAIVAMVVAAVFLIVALVFLLQGVVAALVTAGLSVALADFAVGAAVAVLALITIVVALRRVSASKLVPSRSLRQARETADLVKGPAQ